MGKSGVGHIQIIQEEIVVRKFHVLARKFHAQAWNTWNNFSVLPKRGSHWLWRLRVEHDQIALDTFVPSPPSLPLARSGILSTEAAVVYPTTLVDLCVAVGLLSCTSRWITCAAKGHDRILFHCSS